MGRREAFNEEINEVDPISTVLMSAVWTVGRITRVWGVGVCWAVVTQYVL